MADFKNFNFDEEHRVNIPVEEECDGQCYGGGCHCKKEGKETPEGEVSECLGIKKENSLAKHLCAAREKMNDKKFNEDVDKISKRVQKNVYEYLTEHPDEIDGFLYPSEEDGEETYYSIDASEVASNTFVGVCNEIFRLQYKKNKDYGSSADETFKEFGLVSYLVRLSDKLNRLKSLTLSGEREVKDESIEDTLKDLAAYAIMAVVSLRNKNDKQ